MPVSIASSGRRRLPAALAAGRAATAPAAAAPLTADRLTAAPAAAQLPRSLLLRSAPLRASLLTAALAAATWILPPPAAAQAAGQPPAGSTSPDPSAPAAPAAPGVPAVSESIQVTATRVPEDVEPVPASITVVSGEELAARGATDLATALATVAGVAVAPGGDAGTASSIPELWGLREFDAFLLVVDGVPWGGAFNPALSTLDLTGVERIEVLRGAAPVLFGATSFVGVIHVIHRQPGAPGGSVRAWGGSYGTGGGAATSALPALGGYQQSVSVNGERQGLSQVRSGWKRGHLLYRGSLATGAGTFHVDFDDNVTDQKPASPTPRDGTILTPLVPVDSNENPLHSKIDVNRLQLNLGWDQRLGGGTWSTLVSGTHANQTVARGFLENIAGTDPDNHGIRQHLSLTDFYFDSHVAFDLGAGVRLVAGVDNIYGKAHNASSDWDFFSHVDGSNPPDINSFSPFGATDLRDRRNFSGLYAQTEWTPTHRWRIQLGGRLNHTHESLDATAVSFPLPAVAAAGAKDVSVGPGSARRTVTRGSGSAGVSYLAWEGGENSLWVYGDVRDSFKPAALDFGPDVNGVILRPETARAYEMGLKGRQLGNRFDWEASLFQMDFKNLVVAQLDAATGNPVLVNGGNDRFKGVELEAEVRLAGELRLQGVWSYHDARFTDFLALNGGGVLEQLAGNRLPLSARQMGALGLLYYPRSGLTGWVTLNYTGSRFLDRENTALVPSYTTWAAGVGYRFAGWELRLDGWNLNDARPAIAASEFGADQFYRLSGRSFRGTAMVSFR
jgi:iron complex outermembrane receptor protein